MENVDIKDIGDHSDEASCGSNVKCPSTLSQDTDNTPLIIKEILEHVPPKLHNYVIRTIMAIIMLSGFVFIIYMGPLALVCLVLAIQLKCTHEIITIGYNSLDLPGFRALSWPFLFTSNYFFFGESFIDKFRILLAKEDFLQPLMTHHRFISFCLYCAAVVGFVLSLVKKYDLKQFALFGWTHVTLMIIVWSSHCIMKNIFNGIIWFLMQVSVIICNDIFAYLFGFFLGKTPLIKLSPKKTWEGYIGGGISTVVFSVFLSLLLIHYDYFVCPIEYDDFKGALSMECVRNPVFQPVNVTLPSWLFMISVDSVTWYPFIFHSIIIAIFSSVVGPFAGFFASGFKRAFGIKDFGDTIPGHGGIMDRFDCQYLMGPFVTIYLDSFIRIASTNSLLQQIFVLSPTEQLDFYRQLTGGLIRRGVLNSTSGGLPLL